ncbi:hypothetical protein BX616_002793 [Lobosporangium transversale]|uniref:DASH complex subunit DAM1 n=1 Tax=Lobosporangium transversale TaxID=64571 RepID=A0A1Y2H286_9FUNG|nr:hypothetical protein BCR41DRAFT_417809 [Lobosporangium transversale]KAF9916797.1 hypothetical protein BX616_002793 [Lobosporangium transversale]ORZ28667.1 hypothetical protein BCR41DRAFT_417809 [Lobosporangium transversale]|eukprot:XP_021886340.1 hypothetical protein BCR41DRAFT_417809 [Lobosporangium transversale]
MLQGTPRRKSRIGPGLFFRRSIGPNGGGGITPTETNNLLRNSLRHDHSSQDTLLFRRSQHQYQQELLSTSAGAGTGEGTTSLLHSEPNVLQHQSHQSNTTLTQSRSISEVLENPIDQLCTAVDQLVEKMEVVADIHAGLANFNETFGAFLYGLKINAGNVKWTEAPTKQSFERMEQREAEAIMLQQQQEELERIRTQQLLEQEQERERQRIEAERQEAERIKASLPSLHNGRNRAIQKMNEQDLNRQRRPVTNGRATAPASRIPARPKATTPGASRVGNGGAIRKLAGKVNMKRMIERLPLRYRNEPHRGFIETIMRSLSEHIEGQTLPELVALTNLVRHRCNEYLGVLIHAKEVVRNNQKGVVFSLNPDRYPSR